MRLLGDGGGVVAEEARGVTPCIVEGEDVQSSCGALGCGGCGDDGWSEAMLLAAISIYMLNQKMGGRTRPFA